VVDEFLHEMLINGIKKISAITLLYEETEKRLATAQQDEALSYEKLSEISREALRLHDVRIHRLPPMRVLTSRLKTGQAADLGEGDNMQNLFAAYGFLPQPGLRNCFYRKEPGDEWVMLMQIPQDYENATPYLDENLPGGLFALASSFFEDMDDTFMLLREWADKSNDYALDTERDEMLEEIMPWDIVGKFNRNQQDVFVPIRLGG